MQDLLNLNMESADINIIQFLLNLLIAGLLGLITVTHFRHYAKTVSGKRTISTLIPFIAIVTAIIITIVKSSLALSLGLVGALSIVRFRTPIKDPIELAYIFVAIAIGLGTGAGQISTIVTGVLMCLFIMSIYMKISKRDTQTIYLSVTFSEVSLEIISKLQNDLLKDVSFLDLRKFNYHDGSVEMIYMTETLSIEKIERVVKDFQDVDPNVEITILDHSYLPQV
jgi:uncharacterized membrane protein YhiD involved in acid resistance